MRKIVSLFLCALCALCVFAGCGGGSKPINLTLNFSGTQAIDNGQSLNITVMGAGSKGVMWSLASAGTLTNMTTTSVTYNAQASGASVTDHLTATSLDDSTKTATLAIMDNPPPSITTTSLPAGTEGTAYSQTVAATGGAGMLTLSITGAGTLPAGLTMSSGGAITGTPTGPNGTASFTVKVTDSSVGSTGPQSNTQALSILINLPPPPSITTTSLPNATEGTAYNQTVAATGGLTPYTFTISSASGLPAGLSMDTSGHITGTPTGPNGTSNFTVKVTDSSNPKQSATQNLSITVNLPPPPSITTATLPAGVEGAAYNQTLAATGGVPPYTFAVTTGALPAGLTMDTSGHITGTPAGPNGSTSFTVTVTDKSNPPQTGSKGLSITINLPPAPTIAPTTLPNGNVGTPYSQTLTVSGGLGPFTWIVSSGTLPAGLTLTTNSPTTTAKISGTPTTAQSSVAFTISVTDTSNPPQVGMQAYTVTINPPAPLAITTTSLPNGAFNMAYSTTINATGGIAPYTFSLDPTSGPLPAGLSFTNDAVNNQGKISGTPTTAGMFTNIIVDVHDSQVPTAATAKATFTLTITASAIVISPSSGALPAGTVNTAYTTNITATGGVSPYTFSLDAASTPLPAGLMFSATATQGTISGTPTTAATTNGIIVDVKDSESPPVTVKATYSITINAASACTTGGSESLLNGGYAILLKGVDSSGNPVLIGGVLTFDGAGKITVTANVSVIDINQSSGSTTNNVTSGCFSVGSDHRGFMVITTSAGTLNFRFSLGNISGTPAVASTGHVIAFDTTGPFVTGTMRKQSGGSFSPSSVSGSFAFGGSSLQNFGGGKFAIVGVISFNGSGGITSGFEDVNLNGTLDESTSNTTWPASPVITFNSSGSSYTLGGNGHGTLTVAITGTAFTFHAYLFAVSSTEALFMSSDSQTTTNITAGEALKQTGAGSFTNSSVSGTFAGYTSALGKGGAGTTDTEMIVVNIANPNITGNTVGNDSGTISSMALSGITYSVAPSGRTLLSGAGVGNHAPLLLIVDANHVFFLNSNGRVNSGFFESQTSTSASGAYAFGVIDPSDRNVTDESGIVSFASPNISVTFDSNSSGTLTVGGTNSATFSVDSMGGIHVPSGCTTTCVLGGLVISPTRLVVIELNISNPKIYFADQ